MKAHWPVVVLLALPVAAAGCASRHVPAVGSKSFTESLILAELAAQLAQSEGARLKHRRQLGGTQVLWKALVRGDIDVYPEYTGTIGEQILKDPTVTDEAAIRAALSRHGIRMSHSLGFNNTYVIGLKELVAQQRGIRTISDLQQHPHLKFGFSNEFMERPDGWPGLSQAYRLPQQDVTGLDHDLAYRGLESGKIHATDLYSTDAEIRYYDLRMLEDDRHHFPSYQAVFLYRADLEDRAPEVVAALHRLEGRINAEQMTRLNGEVKLLRKPDSRVAADFLFDTFGVATEVREVGPGEEFLKNTWDHLYLVALSLSAAIVIAVPLGILGSKWPALGQVILAVSGILQTIPSLALFVFLIPLLGIGAGPVLVGLFLYSLLPIVRNTYTGLRDIPPHVQESAIALGLPALARLRLVELPLAARSILAGIKTSAVINVGTATIGAFLGAGGYGQPIVTGLRLDDWRLILLQGAIPAAVLALLVQGVFELAERRLVAKGLRLKAGT